MPPQSTRRFGGSTKIRRCAGGWAKQPENGFGHTSGSKIRSSRRSGFTGVSSNLRSTMDSELANLTNRHHALDASAVPRVAQVLALLRQRHGARSKCRDALPARAARAQIDEPPSAGFATHGTELLAGTPGANVGIAQVRIALAANVLERFLDAADVRSQIELDRRLVGVAEAPLGVEYRLRDRRFLVEARVINPATAVARGVQRA